MSIKKILKKIVLFKELSDVNLNKIAALGKLCSYKPGQLIFNENTSGNALYIVFSGVVKIFTQTGVKKRTLAYLYPAEFFGEMSLIDLKPRCASAVAVEECELMIIKKNDFNKLLSKNIDIALYILKTLIVRLRDADREIERITFKGVPGRLAKVLVDLAGKYSSKTDNGHLINIKLSHQDFAEIAGASREMITKQFNNFRRLKYIELQNKKIIIKNLDKLKELSSFY